MYTHMRGKRPDAMLQALEQFVGGYMNNNNLQMQGGMSAAAPYAGMTPYAMQQSPFVRLFKAR